MWRSSGRTTKAIGRWGSFINQEAHGGEVSRTFLENLFLPDWIINQMYINGAYYHPTFCMNRCGVWQALFFFYVIWYSFGRFFIESIRTDSLYIVGELHAAQLVSGLAGARLKIQRINRTVRKRRER